MSHDYHEANPGYHPGQVLHDGCAQCARRAATPDHGLSDMDPATFARAWRRAANWQRHGESTLSQAELPALRVLWAVQVQLERLGWPLGELPRAQLVAVTSDNTTGDQP